jgi:hypothetical protein
MKIKYLVLSISLIALAGCAATAPQSVSIEKKGKVTIVHHRRKTSNGAVDHIETINASGAWSAADIHVYDVGRYIDSSGNVHEAHQMYRVVQSTRPNLMLPRNTHPTGPRTALTAPNYTAPPKDQRINDAIAEAKAAKERLDTAAKKIEGRVAEDNALRGQLQDQIDENQRLRNQLEAAMNTPKHQAAQSDAEKAAQSSTDSLAAWGRQVQQ